MRSCEGLFWQFGHSVGHSQPHGIPGGLAYAQNIHQRWTALFRSSNATGYAPLMADFLADQQRNRASEANRSSPKISHHVEC